MGKDKQPIQMLQQANMRQALVAGALSGIAVDSVLHPLGLLPRLTRLDKVYSCLLF